MNEWMKGVHFALKAVGRNDKSFIDERMRDAAVMRAVDECQFEANRLLEQQATLTNYGPRHSTLIDLSVKMRAAREQWGENADRNNTTVDWVEYIKKQAIKAIETEENPGDNPDPALTIRDRFLKIAQLALHAVEDIDRHCQRSTGKHPALAVPYTGETPQPSPDEIYKLMAGYGAPPEVSREITTRVFKPADAKPPQDPDWGAIRAGMITPDKLAEVKPQRDPDWPGMIRPDHIVEQLRLGHIENALMAMMGDSGEGVIHYNDLSYNKRVEITDEPDMQRFTIRVVPR